MSLNIPEDYIEFLYWVKEQTEAFWSRNPKTSTADFVCEDWAYGAKWIGLEEAEIDAIEEKYKLKFTPDHRAFLRILHTIDRKKVITYEPEEEGEEIETYEESFFYNWKEDDELINEYLKWPQRTMFEDVLGANRVWLESWGNVRPKSDDEKQKIFDAWLGSAPKLVPITGHRFVVGEPVEKMSPVLSMWGTDIIVYGWNMRHYLLRELEDHLECLHEWVYDEEDKQWYIERKKEYQDIHNFEYSEAAHKEIPVLEEMILYWSSGWGSYGKQYPRENDDFLQPIVKTFIPEDEEEQPKQKMFDAFDKNSRDSTQKTD